MVEFGWDNGPKLMVSPYNPLRVLPGIVGESSDNDSSLWSSLLGNKEPDQAKILQAETDKLDSYRNLGIVMAVLLIILTIVYAKYIK